MARRRKVECRVEEKLPLLSSSLVEIPHPQDDELILDTYWDLSLTDICQRCESFCWSVDLLSRQLQTFPPLPLSLSPWENLCRTHFFPPFLLGIVFGWLQLQRWKNRRPSASGPNGSHPLHPSQLGNTVIQQSSTWQLNLVHVRWLNTNDTEVDRSGANWYV